MKTIYIKLSNRCNLNCRHCYVNKTEGEMNHKDFEAILEELDRMRSNDEKFEVIFHGGEPMLSIQRAHLQAIRTMNTLNIPVTITTNLAYAMRDSYLEIIKCMKPSRDAKPFICTSWDYDIRFHNTTVLENWENNVTLLFKQGVDIQVITTVTKLLIDNMKPEELFEYFKGFGFTKVNFERLTINGEAKKQSNKDIIPTNKEMREWLFEAYKINKEKFHFTIPLFDNLEWAKKGVYNGCRARQCAKNVITFNPDGTVGTCPNIYNEVVRCVYAPTNTQDCVTVLSGDNVYKNICAKEATRHNECYTCPYFKVCNGDCFQLQWDKTGCPGLQEIMEVL